MQTTHYITVDFMKSVLTNEITVLCIVLIENLVSAQSRNFQEPTFSDLNMAKHLQVSPKLMCHDKLRALVSVEGLYVRKLIIVF